MQKRNFPTQGIWWFLTISIMLVPLQKPHAKTLRFHIKFLISLNGVDEFPWRIPYNLCAFPSGKNLLKIMMNIFWGYFWTWTQTGFEVDWHVSLKMLIIFMEQLGAIFSWEHQIHSTVSQYVWLFCTPTTQTKMKMPTHSCLSTKKMPGNLSSILLEEFVTKNTISLVKLRQ